MEKSTTNNPYVLVEGVRLYGEARGTVAAAELDHLEITSATILHITRHLAEVSPAVRARLKELSSSEQLIDDAYIDTQLAVAGSKFHPQIQDPWQLIECMCSWLKTASAPVTWIYEASRQLKVAHYYLHISAEQKAVLGLAPEEYLGTLGVVLLTEENRPRVQQELRGKGEVADRIQVNVLREEPMAWTDHLCIDLGWKDGRDAPELGSTYTGIITPAFPAKGTQSDEQYAYTKDWWDHHAFLV